MRIILFAFPLLASCVSVAQVSTTNGNDLARRVVTNELQTETKDQSHWFFLLQTYKPGGTKESDQVVETKDGDLKRPLLINGRRVNPAEANRQLEQMAHHHDGLQKSLER